MYEELVVLGFHSDEGGEVQLNPKAEGMLMKSSLKVEKEGLFQVMEKLIRSWAPLSVQFMGSPVDGIAPLPLERAVQWKSSECVLVVIRSAADLGKLLAEAVMDGESADSANEDIFTELVNIYCGHLIAELHIPRGPLTGSFLPKTSCPADWPGRPPDAACALLVADTPVEIRFWMGVADRG